MKHDSYVKTEGALARDLLVRINKAWHGSPFDKDRTVVYMRPLSFLPAWMLVEASDFTSVPEKKMIGLDNGQQTLPISYNAQFVEALMLAEKAQLSHETVTDYVRFWVQYTRLSQEQLIQVDEVDDIPWREDITPQARKGLARHITPLTYLGQNAGQFILKGCAYFRDSLFELSYGVEPSGKVHIHQQTLLAESITGYDKATHL